MTPRMKMYTLGHDFVPSSIHAGGLRYHGMALLALHVPHEGLMDSVAIPQTGCFEAVIEFARTQGIVPAPKSAHALGRARREALEAKEPGEEKVIVVGLAGHGLLEIGAYDQFPAGKLTDGTLGEEALKESLAGVPEV